MLLTSIIPFLLIVQVPTQVGPGVLGADRRATVYAPVAAPHRTFLLFKDVQDALDLSEYQRNKLNSEFWSNATAYYRFDNHKQLYDWQSVEVIPTWKANRDMPSIKLWKESVSEEPNPKISVAQSRGESKIALVFPGYQVASDPASFVALKSDRDLESIMTTAQMAKFEQMYKDWCSSKAGPGNPPIGPIMFTPRTGGISGGIAGTPIQDENYLAPCWCGRKRDGKPVGYLFCHFPALPKKKD